MDYTYNDRVVSRESVTALSTPEGQRPSYSPSRVLFILHTLCNALPTQSRIEYVRTWSNVNFNILRIIRFLSIRVGFHLVAFVTVEKLGDTFSLSSFINKMRSAAFFHSPVNCLACLPATRRPRSCTHSVLSVDSSHHADTARCIYSLTLKCKCTVGLSRRDDRSR